MGCVAMHREIGSPRTLNIGYPYAVRRRALTQTSNTFEETERFAFHKATSIKFFPKNLQIQVSGQIPTAFSILLPLQGEA